MPIESIGGENLPEYVVKLLLISTITRGYIDDCY